MEFKRFKGSFNRLFEGTTNRTGMDKNQPFCLLNLAFYNKFRSIVESVEVPGFEVLKLAHWSSLF